MKNAIEIKNLTKRFDKFTLDNISFSLPTGSVMGLIGENGAGKSTTIKLLLGLLHTDSGTVSMLGMDAKTQALDIKRHLGVVSEVTAHPLNYRAQDIGYVLRAAYPRWDESQFQQYLKLFCIDPTKMCKDLSKGMRMKLSIACALCHDAKVLILDEPTSGLDPVVRDEVLDILRDFMQDEQHSILISSHITSDLEKIADYITFLHDGKVVFSQSILAIQENYGVLRCSHETIQDFAAGTIYAKRQDQFGCEVLVDPRRLPAGMTAESASIEQIMLFLTRYPVARPQGGF